MSAVMCTTTAATAETKLTLGTSAPPTVAGALAGVKV
jgi:hypothetical protein